MRPMVLLPALTDPKDLNEYEYAQTSPHWPILKQLARGIKAAYQNKYFFVSFFGVSNEWLSTKDERNEFDEYES